MVSGVRRSIAFSLFILSVLVHLHPSRAAEQPRPDRLRLKNGDQISGRIVDIKDNTILIETSYAGTISVQRDGIESITSRPSVRITTRKGDLVEGTISKVAGDKLVLKTSTGLRTLSTAEVWDLAMTGRETPAWKGKISGGLSLTEGNSSTRTYNLRGEVLHRTFRDEVRLRGQYLFERSEGSTTTDRAEGQFRLSHHFDPVWFTYAMQRLEHDRLANLDVGSDSSVGLGFRVIDRSDLRLDFEFGPAYTFKHFDSGDHQEYISGRLGNRLHVSFPRGVTLEFESEYVQGFKDKEDFVTRANLDLRVPLRNGLYFVLSAQERYDNTPAEGSERNDITVLSNVEYNF